MKGSRAVVLGVIVWLIVVGVGSTAVWTVISRTGQELVGASATSPSGASRPSGAEPSGRASSRQTDKPVGKPAGSGGVDGSPSASGPGASSSAQPGGSPSADSSAPVALAERSTWSGTAGTVNVECRATRLTWFAMIPSAGFSAEVDDRGSSSLEVKFEGQGEGGRETKVEARCVGGKPRFRAETEDSEDGDGDGDGADS